MNDDLEKLVTDGQWVELSKDGDRYVAKLFKKSGELAVAFGRGDSIGGAIQVLLEKLK